MVRWELLVVGLCSLGCGGEDLPPPPLRLATYNGGFGNDVAYREERLAPQIEALLAQDLDLLCVQEYWAQFDALAAAATRFDRVQRLDPLAGCAAGCTAEELDPILTCGDAHCAGLAGGELQSCGIDHCSPELGAVSDSCLGCVIEGLPEGLEGLAECASASAGMGEQHLYGCAYDTAILTRAEIIEQGSLSLDSSLVTAAVDFVRIDTPSGPLDVFCTHLASEIAEIAYEGEHGSWKGLQATQIDQLLAFIADENGEQRPAVLMGDLNTGPQDWPDHYEKLVAAGFDNFFEGCTLCPDNTFQGSETEARAVDHILLRNPPTTPRVTPFMTEKTSVEVGGDAVVTSHSDHHGLVLELSGADG